MNSKFNKTDDKLNEGPFSLAAAGQLKVSNCFNKNHSIPEKIIWYYYRIAEKISFFQLNTLRKIFYSINLTSDKITEEFKDLPEEAFRHRKIYVTGMKFVRYRQGKNLVVDFKMIQDYLKRIDKAMSYLSKIKKDDSDKSLNQIKDFLYLKSIPTNLDTRKAVSDVKKYKDEYIKFFNQDSSKLLKQRLDKLKKIVNDNKESGNRNLLNAIKIVEHSLTKNLPKLIHDYNYNARIVQRLMLTMAQQIQAGRMK